MRRVTVDELKVQRDGHLWHGTAGERPTMRRVGELVEVERDGEGRPVRWWVRLGQGVIEYVRREP